MTLPITPEDIVSTKEKYFPPLVIESWNYIIAKNFSNGYSCVKQDEIAKVISDNMGISRTEVFDKKYLDIEDLYRSYGWKVEYDKPAYNESYPASFTFKKKK